MKSFSVVAICIIVSCFAFSSQILEEDTDFYFSSPSYFILNIGFSNHATAVGYDSAPWDEGSKFEKIAPMVGLGIGYQATSNIRLEMNFNYRRPSYNHLEAEIRTKFHNKNYTAFANAYYDFANSKGDRFITPYVTAGIGFSRNVTSTTQDDDVVDNYYPGNATNGLAFNSGVGSRLRVDTEMYLDVGYRFLYLGNIRFKHQPDGTNLTGKPVRWMAHEILLGLVYNC